MPSYRQKFEGKTFILLRIHRVTYERQYAYADKRRKIIIKGERERDTAKHVRRKHTICLARERRTI